VGLGGDPADPRDAESLRECLPEVLAAVSRLLERVRNGELGRPPGDEPLASVRAGWL
jgi:hypothetical protein